MGLSRKLMGGALAAGAAAALATRVLERTPMLPAPFAGTPHRFPWRHADIFTTVRG
ncbi:hypothetical protein BH18GEM1_BH18GEM1_15320 [soil metagenome]